MRFANIADRLALATPVDTVVDVERATGGKFGARIQNAFEHWDELLEVAAGLDPAASDAWSHIPETSERQDISERDRQVVGPGEELVSYVRHVGEMRHLMVAGH
ncbi:hypothetical protein APR12_005514 [Nocardia amikacinitolerans]|uniref:hypothetical protein n=1 Tax=Nocardia amikacinitolerans TaxID=756689 RepID=UPI0008295561|nr:hypothetical protein [Nocardia amikacinitolerans]MCP2320133.1 hypothetical protein [Nocardia amikacinitolerans]